MGWNKKILDYEIETYRYDASSGGWDFGWNKKILDYEIETLQLRSGHAKKPGWNKKILDYEIETDNVGSWDCWVKSVEIRRFSITRLKLRS